METGKISPWTWILGAGGVLLLLVLGRGGSSSGGVDALGMAKLGVASQQAENQAQNERLNAVLNYAAARDSVAARSKTEQMGLAVNQYLGLAKISAERQTQQEAIAAARESQRMALENDARANRYAFDLGNRYLDTSYQLGTMQIQYQSEADKRRAELEGRRVDAEREDRAIQGMRDYRAQQNDFLLGFFRFIGGLFA